MWTPKAELPLCLVLCSLTFHTHTHTHSHDFTPEWGNMLLLPQGSCVLLRVKVRRSTKRSWTLLGGNTNAILVFESKMEQISYFSFQTALIFTPSSRSVWKHWDIKYRFAGMGVSSPLWTEPNSWRAFKHVVLLLVGGGHLFHITRTKKLLSPFASLHINHFSTVRYFLPVHHCCLVSAVLFQAKNDFYFRLGSTVIACVQLKHCHHSDLCCFVFYSPQDFILEINELRYRITELENEKLQYEKKLKSTKVSSDQHVIYQT